MSSRSQVLRPKGLLVLLLAVLAVAGGWSMGTWQARRQGDDQPRDALLQQLSTLENRHAKGQSSEADQQRLLELLVALDRWPEAIALLEPMADRQPERWSLRLLLAELRRNQNDRPGAEREVRQLLNLKPDRIEALQLMTLLQLEQGRGDQAQAQLQATLERLSKPQVRPEAMGVGLLLADLLQKRGQPGQARAIYLRLGAAFPRDVRPLLAQALLLQEKGETKGAQELLAQARQLQPETVDRRLDKVAAAWGLAPLRGSSPSGSPQKSADAAERQSP
ncbi:tetratricopeptide repeat protein [Synechococcus sp. CBW1002]|jgi:tetratricopeptide (TPR) repeat protein|uniref:tetratricopeptide repeat protein n=1 Tax=Synechococcus sp. CBW1002 TaxID=1353134 RepID=UPI0018CF9795|nr:tetratricopeptide repeat protein [Synechococcus sp. CBW1002]QPN59824.1 tetratricopeptide repeat protein [Synechococcus sp. CBW1002]